MENMAVPGKLYKYQPCTEYSLENLRNNQVWLSKPATFNDPFDSSISFQLSETDATDTDWRLLMRSFIDDKNFMAELKSKNIELSNYCDENDRPTDYGKRMVLTGTAMHNQDWVERLQQHGVACFTGRRDSILMWSHYADKHQGFCMEFDTEYPPFRPGRDAIFRVEYSPSYPPISLAEYYLIRRPSVDTVRKALISKSLDWSYEQEWRLLDAVGDHRIRYPHEALTGVYFGCRITPEVRAQIDQALTNAGYTGLKYQMRRCVTEFKLETEVIA